MLKAVGCILTAGGCAGLGFWYRRQLTGRIVHVKILISILDMMMSEVRYSKAPLPECCRRLSERVPEPYRSGFFRIWEESRENQGEDYGKIFVRNMEKSFGQVPLGKEERACFLELADRYGYEDAKMQLRSMEQCREQLEELKKRLEKDVGEKGKAALCLGILGGLFLLIVFW